MCTVIPERRRPQFVSSEMVGNFNLKSRTTARASRKSCSARSIDLPGKLVWALPECENGFTNSGVALQSTRVKAEPRCVSPCRWRLQNVPVDQTRLASPARIPLPVSDWQYRPTIKSGLRTEATTFNPFQKRNEFRPTTLPAPESNLQFNARTS